MLNIRGKLHLPTNFAGLNAILILLQIQINRRLSRVSLIPSGTHLNHPLSILKGSRTISHSQKGCGPICQVFWFFWALSDSLRHEQGRYTTQYVIVEANGFFVLLVFERTVSGSIELISFSQQLCIVSIRHGTNFVRECFFKRTNTTELTINVYSKQLEYSTNKVRKGRKLITSSPSSIHL